MAGELDRRTGIKPRDVTEVFVTHGHDNYFLVDGVASNTLT
jgi:hypothetical protein